MADEHDGEKLLNSWPGSRVRKEPEKKSPVIKCGPKVKAPRSTMPDPEVSFPKLLGVSLSNQGNRISRHSSNVF